MDHHDHSSDALHHEDDHPHEDHDHDHPHDHHHASGWWATVQEVLPFFHGHHHGDSTIDSALEGSTRGIWALKASLLGLGATALFQLLIASLSGSVGLLADTIHNFSDAFTAIPLWIAFALARRAATRRYTYGYGRAEDIAGIIIVLIILGSALVAGYESVLKVLHPAPLRAVGWVIAAAIVGFLGNEGVALFRIRVGRAIGSAALVADGQHARVDGLTSLAVLFGALGSLLGFPLADPLIGLLITIAILFIVKDTAVTMWHRLMDAVDPALVHAIERVAGSVAGVQQVRTVRVRWLGHTLQAEVQIVTDEDLSVRESHQIVEAVRHALVHAQPHLMGITVHVDPCGHNGTDPHELTAHHHLLTAHS